MSDNNSHQFNLYPIIELKEIEIMKCHCSENDSKQQTIFLSKSQDINHLNQKEMWNNDK